MALDDVGVEAGEVRRLLAEALLGRRELQDLGHAGQVAPLVVGQHAVGAGGGLRETFPPRKENIKAPIPENKLPTRIVAFGKVNFFVFQLFLFSNSDF